MCQINLLPNQRNGRNCLGSKKSPASMAHFTTIDLHNADFLTGGTTSNRCGLQVSRMLSIAGTAIGNFSSCMAHINPYHIPLAHKHIYTHILTHTLVSSYSPAMNLLISVLKISVAKRSSAVLGYSCVHEHIYPLHIVSVLHVFQTSYLCHCTL